MKTQPRGWSALALVLILLIALGWRLLRGGPAVEVLEVQPGPVVSEVFGTGTLEARVKATLSSRLQERLAEVLVDQGDPVREGQVLARLDEGELRRQVDVAVAGLAAAQATAERVKVDETRAEAVAAQARQDHVRLLDLVAQRVSAQSDLDKAVERLQVAESDLLRARAATREAQELVNAAGKSVAYHQERLGFARLTSPFDGLVTRRDRDPGGVVVPGSSILQVISTNEIWVAAWVDETAAAALQPGQPARVVFRSEPEREFPGEVVRLGRETDRETREFLVDVRVRELPRNWTVGQRAEVSVETAREAQVLRVPERFVHWREGRSGVWVVRDRRVEWREVTLAGGDRTHRVVRDGLQPGERVAWGGTGSGQDLRPGQRVRVP